MRTHRQIVADAGGPKKLHRRLGIAGGYETVKSWAMRDRIPSHYWLRLANEGVATLHELAVAADAKGDDRQQSQAA
jgi:hypothetical protein